MNSRIHIFIYFYTCSQSGFASLNSTLLTENLISRNFRETDIAPPRYAFRASSTSKLIVYKFWRPGLPSLSQNELIEYLQVP